MSSRPSELGFRFARGSKAGMRAIGCIAVSCLLAGRKRGRLADVALGRPALSVRPIPPDTASPPIREEALVSTYPPTPNEPGALLNDLSSRLDGRVVGPEDARWSEARRAWNLAVEQRPAAVAMPQSAQDVMSLVEVAREHGLRVAPQGTGHSAAPRASLERSVLADMSGMNAVKIDPDRRRAQLQAGAQWQHVTSPAAAHGLAGLSGSAPDVCVTGYALPPTRNPSCSGRSAAAAAASA